MPRLKVWLPALVLAALFLLATAMCARAEESAECIPADAMAVTLAGQHPPFVAYDELAGADLAAFLAVTGGDHLAAVQIVAFMQLHTDGVMVLLFNAGGCLIAWAEDSRYGYDAKAKLARERAGS